MSTIGNRLHYSHEIPYQDWNRPNLVRRPSDPHRSRTQARGHQYTVSKQKAAAALQTFLGNEHGERWPAGLNFRVLFQQRRLRPRQHQSESPALAAGNAVQGRLIKTDWSFIESGLRSLGPSGQVTLSTRPMQTFTFAKKPTEPVKTFENPSEDLAESVVLAEQSVQTVLWGSIDSDMASMRIVDAVGDLLACERCPLVFPDMPHFWGIVQVSADG